MSGYPSGSGEGESGGTMNALLAQLRQGQQDKRLNLEPSFSYYNSGNHSTENSFYPQHQPPQHQQTYGYQQPSMSSPVPTPPMYNLPPHHSSAVLSPVETPQPQQPQFAPTAMGGPSNANRTSSLLGLLKFQQPSTNSSKQPAPIGTPIGTPLPPSREPSQSFAAAELVGHTSPTDIGRHGSDLLAALMGNAPKPTQLVSPQLAAPQPVQPSGSFSSSPPGADTQNFLLKLLNQPKPPQSESAPQLKPAKVLTPPSKASSQNDVSELTQALEEASLDMSLMGSAATEGTLQVSLGKENAREEAPKTQGLFTYVNPFDQLAASSPRVRTPKNPNPNPPSAAPPAIQILKRQIETPDNKRKVDERSDISSPGLSHSKRKLEATSAISSGQATPLPDERSKLEALTGIDSSGNKESVAAALQEAGEEADREVQDAIARAENDRADETQALLEKNIQEMLLSKTEEEFQQKAQVTAKSIKVELDKKENSHALDDLPTPVADLVKDIVEDTAQGHIADSWESADAEDSPVKEEEEENAVKVFNFPMKPWTSITIKGLPEESRAVFRDEAVMDIARLKKDFDQVDRTLVTASNNFIVYGMSKNGGIRIIRQDDGRDARLFTETHDRIFSVVVSVSIPDMKEAILGTGISGTVYWALIKDGQGDHIEDNNPELYGFALPAIQTSDNDAPGGMLKTRARKSSNHPEFFAVGRGKAIHIIWPSVILKSCLKSGKDRLVDTDKYLSKFALKVNTGKAGKDFIFSEDDTTIVSLDKAGRVKFWDIRDLTMTDDRGRPSPVPPHREIKDPISTFTTTPPLEKSWPTSVLLVDKPRPYQRGGALRYLIVGMKQNHSLQLWDLALGKPVQEIHLPHSKESDAVCSVLYHANTGMIVVGHPTRNSIYFLHLSAPKYNLPKGISQADFMAKLENKDPSIPKPESTAVVSGMREYSLENKGSLRSLDILQTPSSASTITSQPSALFELYAMHSKGVTCITVKHADLGWTSDNKVLNPVPAEKGNAIYYSIDTLKEIPVAPTPDAVDSTPQPTRIVQRPASKEAVPKESSKKTHHGHPEPSTIASPSKNEDKAEKKETNGATNSSAEKPGKSKRKKTSSSTEIPSSSSTAPQNAQIASTSAATSRNGSAPKAISPAPAEPTAIPNNPAGLSEITFKDAETRIADEVRKLLTESHSSLFQEIKADRRAQASNAIDNQKDLLQMVSKTLANNVDANLNKIVSNNIEKSVVPAITSVTMDVVSSQIKEQLGSKLSSNLGTSIPKELQRLLPDAINKALQQPQLLKLMSESLAKSVAFKVEENFGSTLQKVVIPAFQNLAVQTSQKVAGDVQRQAAQQIGSLERQRQADGTKIDQLMQLVTKLSETVSSMAATQQQFQDQFLQMQQQLASEKRESAQRSQSEIAPSAAQSAPVDDEQLERAKQYQQDYTRVKDSTEGGKLQEGILTWLQSAFQQEIFETFFTKYNPDFICDMSPVILLSIGSAVSTRLDDMLMIQRINWLNTVINALQNQISGGTMDDGLTHIPKIVGTFIQRLEQLFLQISAINAHDPHLKQVSNMVTACKRLIDSQSKPMSSPPNYLGGPMAANPGRRY